MKLHMVFDASAKTSSGYSLNDTLLQGPSLYPLLTTVLLRFRRHDIGMSLDIGKMFREVTLHPDDRDLHRYLTYSKNADQLQEWRMTRVTFGVASSAFLATQVLRTLAMDHGDEQHRVATIIDETFHVDNCLTGTSDLTDAISLRQDLNSLPSKASMQLCKWRTNSSELLDTIPADMREVEEIQVILAPEACHKALGVHWDTRTDHLHVATPKLGHLDHPTKCQVTSDIAKTFDILVQLLSMLKSSKGN